MYRATSFWTTWLEKLWCEWSPYSCFWPHWGRWETERTVSTCFALQDALGPMELPDSAAAKGSLNMEWNPTTTHAPHKALRTLLRTIRKMEKLKSKQRGVVWCCLQHSCSSDRCLTVHRCLFWPKAACVSIIALWASPLPLRSHWTLREALSLALGVGVQSHTPSPHRLSGFSLQLPDMFKTAPRTWQDIGLMVQLNKAHLTSPHCEQSVKWAISTKSTSFFLFRFNAQAYPHDPLNYKAIVELYWTVPTMEPLMISF